MKTNMVRAALACAALVLTATSAFAGVTPIQGTPVGVDHDPGGNLAAGVTGDNGSITFRNLAPGNYVIVIDGKGLIATMDKLHPPVPEKKSGSGVSLSVGGLFGGGGGHGDRDGHGAHGGSGGGVGLGLSVPLGGHPDPSPSATGTVVYTPDGPIVIVAELSIAGTNTVSATTPYCRDSAGAGIRLGFTISDQASAGNIAAKPVSVRLGISDQGSTANLSSY